MIKDKVREAYFSFIIIKDGDIMWQKEDTTYNDIRRKSLEQWLEEMEKHPDVAVRGGVKLTREYIAHLEQCNQRLKDENELKNEYLKKAKGRQ